MSLCGVSDGFLAARVAGGDEAAFTELAGRYRRLVLAASRRVPLGAEADDARQEALIGLLKACWGYDPSRGPFAAFARLCVHTSVATACARAMTPRHLVLSDAFRDGGDEQTDQLAERVAAPEGSDPAIVVALRDRLREHAHERRRRDRRRRYSDEQVVRALALIAQGRTPKQAAHAVGAPTERVNRWVKRAGHRRVAGRHYYSRAEIERALSLLQGGASLRQAGAAVGASSASVLRWTRQAAA